MLRVSIVILFIGELHPSDQPAMEFQLDQAKEILRRTPATLNSLLHQLPNEWALSNEGLDSWSPFDVIGHLIHGEESDWIPRAKLILEHGEERPFAPFDRFAMFERSRGQSLSDLLTTFERLRTESLKELDKMNLTPEMLQKRGRHPELGEVTLSQLLSTWVVHDLGHVGQIVRVMAKQYDEAVGAWRAYLSILSR
jgi:uncharacterized damage-inducible protein DinB